MTDMVASPYASFQAQSGANYTADANGIISDVPIGDVKSLRDAGCDVSQSPVSREDAVFAAGIDVGTATVLSTAAWARITSINSDGGTGGVVAPPAKAGMRKLLINDANSGNCVVYRDPETNDTFSLAASSGMTSFNLFEATTVEIDCMVDGVWNGIYSADPFC